MAKYLDTSQISSELMQLLKEAKERIILVTYSLQVNSQIQERLKTRSKLGTLAEITLIYGNTKIKNAELQWMSEVDDLKVWQKKNLHTKCYINENKAIISSMNLYDYSQTTNNEMGFLITKEEDPEAYRKMMDDVDDLRINGERKRPWLETVDTIAEELKPTEIIEKPKSFTYHQQIKRQLLEFYRSQMSSHIKQNAHSILSDDEIHEIITKNELTIVILKQILKNDKKVNQIGSGIFDVLSEVKEYVIGKIKNIKYQKDEFTYDQVEMTRFDDGSSYWYDTKQELPKKNQVVAVHLNKNWFNAYLSLEESEIKDSVLGLIKQDYSKSVFLTTKELSAISGKSSREINSSLVSLGLMKKNGDDWFTTAKGETYGGKAKDGQYGKFVIWPKEIIADLKLG